MNFLLISIACSVAVSVLLKLARKNGIGLTQAVAVNYPVAALLSLVFLKPDWHNWQSALLPQSWLLALLGVLLPSVFVIMGRAAEQAGIVKADAAQRLSLFLPVLAAFTLFGETLSANKIIGIALAFAALCCLLYKGRGSAAAKGSVPLLLGVWAGYGIIDILLKQLSKTAATADYLSVMFALAALLMAGYLVVRRQKWSRRDIGGGILLGCLNFTNILFYLKAHKAFKDDPTLVFTAMNMGVIVAGTLVGTLLLREKISAVNVAGIVLALAAVACLSYWPQLAAWLGM